MRRLSFMDRWFLLAESRETPNHVGGLYLFTIPEGEDETEFARQQLDILRSPEEWRHPFGDHLEMGALGPAGPTYWEPDEDLDVHYHVRHTVLPEPRRLEELFALAARLHENLLDRRRPLWETHLIEGLQDRQLALYSKVHHAAIDGVSGVRLALEMMSPDPEERRDYSPFSRHAYELAQAQRKRPEREPPTERDLAAVAEVLHQSLGVSTGLLAGLRTYARAWWSDEEQALPTAWTPAPKTSISTKITGRRSVVAHSYSLPRVRAVGKALGGTINDVVLAMCGGALRRYLAAHGELPDKPLMAMTPVSLRTEERGGVGNAVGAVVANLGTHLSDPGARFDAVTASMNEGKSLLRGMNAKEIELFTLLTLTPAMLAAVLGLGDRFSPYSAVISNVRGPRERRYWNGARLDGLYPLSSIYHGYALNITLLSNADQLDFGIVACRETVPNAPRLIEDLRIALEDLERAAGLSM
jgi:WS/DGAT/MGAT family acyltransferase